MKLSDRSTFVAALSVHVVGSLMGLSSPDYTLAVDS
jgi:hypothetical protein